jgi:hypothetical protein
MTTINSIGTQAITTGGTLTFSGAYPFTATLTGSTSVTFPTSGTLATTASIPTGAALTETNDTNVTLTLGGTPATALLAATSITAGWTGTLSPTRGGTGVNNGSNSLTLAGNLTTSGAFATTFTMTGATSVTFPTSGTLTTTADPGLFPFLTVSGATQAASVNTGYVITNASGTTVTLPATAAVGQRVYIVGGGSGPWILAANSGQTIKFLGATTATAGTAASTNNYDSCQVACTVANTTWSVMSAVSAGLTIT